MSHRTVEKDVLDALNVESPGIIVDVLHHVSVAKPELATLEAVVRNHVYSHSLVVEYSH